MNNPYKHKSAAWFYQEGYLNPKAKCSFGPAEKKWYREGQLDKLSGKPAKEY